MDAQIRAGDIPAHVVVSSVRAELRRDSADVATPAPRLSWTSEATMDGVPARGWVQESAEIELDGTDVAVAAGSDSVLVPWPFAPIHPRETHRVRVRARGIDGSLSQWSEPANIRAAFLGPGQWQAPMIGLDAAPRPGAAARPALLRAEFHVAPGLRRATAYATAHGVYQLFVNGHEVDDQILKPGWTPYRSRLVHESTDVTALLNQGVNAVGCEIAGGWFTERYLHRPTSIPFYGDRPAVAVQLVLEYDDGRLDVVATGPRWRATGAGPRRQSSLYDGEQYDARREMDRWAEPGFDDSSWAEVEVHTEPYPTPVARTSPAVRAIEEIPVARVIESSAGQQILDFGQNLVGRMRLRMRGAAGTAVTIRYAEVLEHGELGVRPLRDAKATDTYVLRGDDEETWEPRFTFHGFRYAQVTGLPGDLDPENATAVVIHSDMQRTGWFECSNPMVNQLHRNVVWGMRGNFLYLPTDCPQRDERLGWTGDIQVFSPAACYLYDAQGFLDSWLVDLALEQRDTGAGIVPFVVPNVLVQADRATPAAAWGDAATIVPSVIYRHYGDRDVLDRQFTSMRRWVDAVHARATDGLLWQGGFQFGDWLDPTAPADDAAQAMTDPDVVASAYFYRSTDLTARAAEVIGRQREAAYYGDLARRIKDAFLGEYVDADGSVRSDSQTAYALCIVFGLTSSDRQRQEMGSRLAGKVRDNGYRIGTGFVGTPIIMDALASTGNLDTAAALLTQTENPSWLYPVTMGATTIWERWDSMLPDGTINPGEMTSFNHYALGAVADWLHRSLAGLAPAAPGYRRIRVAPTVLPGFDSARTTLVTPYGIAKAGWRLDGEEVVVEATVPANTTASIILPGANDGLDVGSGEYVFRCPIPGSGSEPGPGPAT